MIGSFCEIDYRNHPLIECCLVWTEQCLYLVVAGFPILSDPSALAEMAVLGKIGHRLLQQIVVALLDHQCDFVVESDECMEMMGLSN